jgi:DNA-directed RNA polymerase subunit RPC12/RpoP
MQPFEREPDKNLKPVIHIPPAIISIIDKTIFSLTRCTKCKSIGTYEDQHPKNPCNHCGSKVEIAGIGNYKNGKWRLKSKKGAFYPILSVGEYLEAGAVKCPNCLGEHIEGTGSLEMDGNWITRVIKCNDCTYRWKDIYTLTGMEEEG